MIEFLRDWWSDKKHRTTFGGAIGACMFLTFGPLWAVLVFSMDRDAPIQQVTGKVIGFRDEDHIVIEWTGTRLRACPGRQHKWIVNSLRVALPSAEIPLARRENVGRPNTWREEIPIPASIAPPAKYEVQEEFYCNFAHRIMGPIIVEFPLIELPITLSRVDRVELEMRQQKQEIELLKRKTETPQ